MMKSQQRFVGRVLRRVSIFCFLLTLVNGAAFLAFHDDSVSPPAAVQAISGGPANPEEMPTKLMVVIYNPILESQGGQRLHQHYNWQDPDALTAQLVNDFRTISHGVVNYQIAERVERDEWPLHKNGQRYTDELYLFEIATGTCCTLGDGDYNAIIRDNLIAEKVNAGLVDEVWLWGAPGFGWAESAMAGDGAFWINGGPITGVSSKAFVVMGYNYERGMAEALESYGHRTESIVRRVYGSWESLETHDWNRFTLLDMNLPGRGGIGNAHNAFNAEPGTDYNRSSLRVLSTSADDWHNFPNMTGARSDKNCTAWGCDGYQYLKWWYDHMPHVPGFKNGLLNNWWRYIADPNQYKANWHLLPSADSDFAENNAAAWSCWAEGATCTLSNDASRVKVGSSSLKFETTGGLDTWVRYPAAGNANWDVSSKMYLSFWAFAINPNLGFQNFSPQVYLRDADDGSYFRYQPSYDVMNDARGFWKRITIPLAGGDGWTREVSGTPSLTDIDQIEIHNDTWEYGFTIYFDGLGFTAEGTDFAESNTAAWSCWADLGATCTLSDDASTVKTGSFSVKFETNGGFDTWVRYPATGNANWNVSSKTHLSFWAFAINPNLGFQNGSPWIYLKSPSGSYLYQPAYDVMNDARGVWKKFSIPLAGGDGWTRTVSGTPTLTDIDQIEIHNDTWDYGFVIYFDGLSFVPFDTTPPNVSLTSPTSGQKVYGTVPVKVDASDNASVFRVDLFIDNQYYATDAIEPFIFQWDTTSFSAGPHTLQAYAYDSSGNAGNSSSVSVNVTRKK